MDDHNNEIGIAIGIQTRTWNEVVAMARDAVANSRRDGNDPAGPRWLAGRRWQSDEGRDVVSWPDINWSRERSSGYRYPYGGETESFNWKIGGETMVMEGWMVPIAGNGGHVIMDLDKQAAMAVLPGVFKDLDAAKQRHRAAGGTVHVDGYTQMRAGKPVDVSDHMRSAPSR